MINSSNRWRINVLLSFALGGVLSSVVILNKPWVSQLDGHPLGNGYHVQTEAVPFSRGQPLTSPGYLHLAAKEDSDKVNRALAIIALFTATMAIASFLIRGESATVDDAERELNKP